MNILHYFLGFPPYRSGGLTKYAFDLMKSQFDDGNKVMALWPGKIRKFGGKPSIKKHKDVFGLKSFELINPLPVSLDEGIRDFVAYTNSCDVSIYIDILSKLNLEVIHMHTLMGLHREFILAANILKIRTVYTSHDYFGLCPKVNFYRYGKCCEDDKECVNCIQCNLNALSLTKIKIMQSPIYRNMKNTSIVTAIRKKHRNNFFLNDTIPTMPRIDVMNVAEEYRDLRQYYLSIFEKIDFFHFNSTLSEKVYTRFLNPKDSNVVSITHQELDKINKMQRTKSDKIRILYLSPAKPYKGFYVLKSALDQLWELSSFNFELILFGEVPCKSPYMKIFEQGYHYPDLPKIFSSADFLVAPSIWYETFGFTVLEAIAYDVPVIVSDHVGAKDVIGNFGMTVKHGDVEDLKRAIIEMCNTYNKFLANDYQKTSVLRTWRDLVNETYVMYNK